MSLEDNMAIARRVIEDVWNQGKVALLDELLAPNFILHDPDRPDVRTREDYKLPSSCCWQFGVTYFCQNLYGLTTSLFGRSTFASLNAPTA